MELCLSKQKPSVASYDSSLLSLVFYDSIKLNYWHNILKKISEALKKRVYRTTTVQLSKIKRSVLNKTTAVDWIESLKLIIIV
jgi:ribosomal protein L18E